MLSPSAGEDPQSHPRGSGEGTQGPTPISMNGHHAGRNSSIDATRVSVRQDVDMGDMDVDELEGDDEDEIDYDGGAGSSESEGYHRNNHIRGRPRASNPSSSFHGY